MSKLKRRLNTKKLLRRVADGPRNAHDAASGNNLRLIIVPERRREVAGILNSISRQRASNPIQHNAGIGLTQGGIDVGDVGRWLILAIFRGIQRAINAKFIQ